MHHSTHPFYQQPSVVSQWTQWLVAQGVTVFQLFQFPGGERPHSEELLGFLDLPQGAKVLSLGSGVGGMERYWHQKRPDLEFELVNISVEQNRLTVCPGRRVRADAEGYVSPREPFDAVVIAYMLGHVHVKRTLKSALENLSPTGKMLIVDVFDSTCEFDQALLYESPKATDVLDFAKEEGLKCTMLFAGLAPTQYAKEHVAQDLLAGVCPYVFILKRGPENDEASV